MDAITLHTSLQKTLLRLVCVAPEKPSINKAKTLMDIGAEIMHLGVETGKIHTQGKI